MNYLPGQLFVLQLATSVSFPLHTAPPFAAGTAITLVLCWVPPPHVAEQDCDAHELQEHLTEGLKWKGYDISNIHCRITWLQIVVNVDGLGWRAWYGCSQTSPTSQVACQWLKVVCLAIGVWRAWSRALNPCCSVIEISFVGGNLKKLVKSYYPVFDMVKVARSVHELESIVMIR